MTGLLKIKGGLQLPGDSGSNGFSAGQPGGDWLSEFKFMSEDIQLYGASSLGTPTGSLRLTEFSTILEASVVNGTAIVQGNDVSVLAGAATGTLSLGNGTVNINAGNGGTITLDIGTFAFASDYSNLYTDRSIVDKAYVDQLDIFTEITDGHLEYNGSTLAYLSDIPADQDLQSVLTAGSVATISQNLQIVNDTTINFISASGSDTTKLTIGNPQSASLSSTDTNVHTTLSTDLTSVLMSYESGGTTNQIQLNSSSMTVEDNLNVQGLVYGADYEDNFTARSLVTKQYVDSGSNTSEVLAASGTADSFDESLSNGVVWDYTVQNGVNLRGGTILAVWNASTDEIVFTETTTNDLGDTSDIVFDVEINTAGEVELIATIASGTWTVKTKRSLI